MASSPKPSLSPTHAQLLGHKFKIRLKGTLYGLQKFDKINLKLGTWLTIVAKKIKSRVESALC